MWATAWPSLGTGLRLPGEQHEHRSSCGSCWLFLGSLQWRLDTGTARPPAAWSSSWCGPEVQAAACWGCGLQNGAVAMSPVPAGARGFTLALAWWFLTAPPSHSQRRMGRGAPGRAESSVPQALPAAFPPSSEGQILSIAPALKSLLPIAVRNSPGLGVSYLWRPARKEECTELPRPPFPQPHALPAAELKLKKFKWLYLEK